MPRPLLKPPCTSWIKDLSHHYPPSVVIEGVREKPPNYLDDIYLEVPRASLAMRGLTSLMAVPVVLFTGYAPVMIADSIRLGSVGLAFIGLVIFLLGVCAVLVTIRTDIAAPRDEPIRFNRLRQKIYVYNFRDSWWNPFIAWRVVPVAYDWSQVYAEHWSQKGVLPNGGVIFKWGVTLSIVAPGTYDVIDRFNLSSMNADEQTWAYICAYMQGGPSALPHPAPPKDPDDLLWYQFALRLAPKVVWPADMDLESRTAP